jgi:hypothetical protein
VMRTITLFSLAGELTATMVLSTLYIIRRIAFLQYSVITLIKPDASRHSA